MATTKKKAKTSKKPATKKKAAAAKTTKKATTAKAATRFALTGNPPLGYSGAPLTPNNNQATANQAMTTKFSDLNSYWNLLRPETYYRVVVAKVSSKDGTTLYFDIVNPATGAAAYTGLSVDLNNGANAYPYFPSTAQQFVTGSSSKYGFLLLSEEYLEATVGVDHVSEVAGPKIPARYSL